MFKYDRATWISVIVSHSIRPESKFDGLLKLLQFEIYIGIFASIQGLLAWLPSACLGGIYFSNRLSIIQS